MSLSNLTTSGWLFLAVLLGAVFEELGDLVRESRPTRGKSNPPTLFMLGVSIAWLLYLVTP